ncbi:MAG: DUF3943 domain-containing protein [Comamonadaceae bacterium]|nr:DUF3943 domain-containing protein [Comamonadaceae bacterium]
MSLALGLGPASTGAPSAAGGSSPAPVLFSLAATPLPPARASIAGAPAASAPAPASLQFHPKPLLAAGEVAGLNFGVWAFLHYFGNAHYSYISWETIRDNLRDGWEWDRSMYFVNFYHHPYHGYLYYSAGRANGLGFWGSSLCAPRREPDVGGDDGKVPALHQRPDHDLDGRDRHRRGRLPVLRPGPEEGGPRPRPRVARDRRDHPRSRRRRQPPPQRPQGRRALAAGQPRRRPHPQRRAHRDRPRHRPQRRPHGHPGGARPRIHAALRGPGRHGLDGTALRRLHGRGPAPLGPRQAAPVALHPGRAPRQGHRGATRLLPFRRALPALRVLRHRYDAHLRHVVHRRLDIDASGPAARPGSRPRPGWGGSGSGARTISPTCRASAAITTSRPASPRPPS